MQIEVVVGLHNGASEGYNVSAIFGSLNHPTQFNTFFYNFSGQVTFDWIMCRSCAKSTFIR